MLSSGIRMQQNQAVRSSIKSHLQTKLLNYMLEKSGSNQEIWKSVKIFSKEKLHVRTVTQSL